MPDMRDAIAQYLASGGRQNQMPPLGDLMGYQAGQNAAAPMAGPPQGMPGMDMRPDLLTPANGSQNAFGPPMPNLQANPAGGFMPPTGGTPYMEPPTNTPMQAPPMQGPMMTGPPQGMPGMDMRPNLTTPANGSQNAFGPPMPNLTPNPAGGFMPPQGGRPF